MNFDPAKHILVKDAQQFIAMLIRRGYDGIQEETDEHGWLCWLNSEYTGRSFVRESFFLYETVATVAERLDKWYGAGQHHMCCIQCKEPLLVTAKYVDEDQQALKWYGCRSPKAGPQSAILDVCPGCGIEFGGERGYPPPLKEIKDVETANQPLDDSTG